MLSKENQSLYLEVIKKREIKYLIHFTPTINLLGIFEEQKILSRKLIEQLVINNLDILDYIEFTDSHRFDDKNFINLSIQSPNASLFKKFRSKTQQDCHVKWCVLKIDTKYIYHIDTIFSITNAANSYNKNNIRITGDIEKFKLMFSPSIDIINSYGNKKLNRGNLPNNYTTDEQAEVLVRDYILASDILEVCFLDYIDLATGKAALSEFDTSRFKVDSSLFKNSRE